jgi:hypothetical protein
MNMRTLLYTPHHTPDKKVRVNLQNTCYSSSSASGIRAGLYRRRFFFSGVFFDRFGSEFSQFAGAAGISHAASNTEGRASGAAAGTEEITGRSGINGNPKLTGVDACSGEVHFKDRRLGVLLLTD